MKLMKNKLILALSIALMIVLAGCAKSGSGDTSNFKDVKITIFHDPSCGCCAIYTDYIKDKGFDVEMKMVSDLAPIKEQYGVPEKLLSCHTSVIGDYFVEGHVPA